MPRTSPEAREFMRAFVPAMGSRKYALCRRPGRMSERFPLHRYVFVAVARGHAELSPKHIQESARLLARDIKRVRAVRFCALPILSDVAACERVTCAARGLSVRHTVCYAITKDTTTHYFDALVGPA